MAAWKHVINWQHVMPTIWPSHLKISLKGSRNTKRILQIHYCANKHLLPCMDVENNGRLQSINRRMDNSRWQVFSFFLSHSTDHVAGYTFRKTFTRLIVSVTLIFWVNCLSSFHVFVIPVLDHINMFDRDNFLVQYILLHQSFIFIQVIYSYIALFGEFRTGWWYETK